MTSNKPLWQRWYVVAPVALVAVGGMSRMAAGQGGAPATLSPTPPAVVMATSVAPTPTPSKMVTTLPATPTPAVEATTAAPVTSKAPVPVPVTKVTTKAPIATNTTTKPASTAPVPAPVRTVTPGAFCSPIGATGVTSTGKAMTCSLKEGDSRARWRAS